MTSLNAPVIFIRFGISFWITRLISAYFGELGFHLVGQIRSLIQILTSVTSLGVFNGIVKYVAEYKEKESELNNLFSTTFVFICVGAFSSFLVLFFGSNFFSNYLFQTYEYSGVIKVVALIAPFIALQRVLNGLVNGLSKYKKFVKIDLIGYLVISAFTLYFAYYSNMDGLLYTIALTPLVQFMVIVAVFRKEIRSYVLAVKPSFKIPMAKPLLAFSLMSFFSTVVLNFIEIEIRGEIVDAFNQEQSGVWVSMTSLSKQYMSFSIMLFTMYVLPKFSVINSKAGFLSELKTIYKTLLPIFGAGMILVYLFRDFIMELVFPGNDKEALEPLFKWQLIGDFIRLMSMVLAYNFIAKKLVRTFIFTELLSLGLFYAFAVLFIDQFGVEGVVMGHLARYIIYFFVVLFLVYRYYNHKKEDETQDVQSET